MKKTILWLAGLSLAVLLPASIAGQTQNRVIEWSETRTSTAIVLDVLEIVDVKVAGNQVTIGRSFAAEDEWLRGLTFRVKNISAAPIIDIRMGITFPETQSGTRVLGLTLFNPELHRRASSNDPARLMPEEEIDLVLTDAQYMQLRRLVAGRSANQSLTKLRITPTVVVKFEGGAEVFGYFHRRQEE